MPTPLPRGAATPPHVRTVSGYLGVVDHLRREISLGRLLPGDRLPAERKLSEQLGVARETLRQALRVLEGSGQIAIIRGAGGAVVLDHQLSQEFVLHDLRERREALLSLVEYRAAIESEAARLAATRRSEEHLAAMVAAQDALAVAPNKDQSRRHDTEFHLAVAAASGNEHLARAVEDARADMFQPLDLATYEFMIKASHDQHQEVHDALVAGDPAAAAAAMRHHVEHTREEILRVIEGLPAAE